MSAVIDIHHLDEEDRELVRYMAEESMSVKKAAQRMCLSVSATRYRLRRIVTRTGRGSANLFRPGAVVLRGGERRENKETVKERLQE